MWTCTSSLCFSCWYCIGQQHLSGASQNIAVECIPLKVQNDREKNKLGKQMNEFELIWTIGVAGGEELVDDDEDNNIDYSSLF
jgi:hypothetical protein